MSDLNPQADRIERIAAALRDIRYQATFISASSGATRQLFSALADVDAAVRAVKKDVQADWDAGAVLIQELDNELGRYR